MPRPDCGIQADMATDMFSGQRTRQEESTMHNHRHWVGTWTTAPAPAEGAAFSNHTVRMNVRASIGGDTLRVRLSNAYGTRKPLVGAARVGLRDTGPAIIKGSDRMLTFGGAESATIAAGSLLISDPVSLPLPPPGDLRDHRPLLAPDELHFAAGQLRLGG